MPILANTRKKVSNAFSRLFTRKTNGLQKPKLRIKIPPNPNEFRKGNLANYNRNNNEPEEVYNYSKKPIVYNENEEYIRKNYIPENNLPVLLFSAEDLENYPDISPGSNPRENNSGSNRSSHRHHKHGDHHHRHHSHKHRNNNDGHRHNHNRHHSHKHRNNNNGHRHHSHKHRHHSHKHKHHNHRRNK